MPVREHFAALQSACAVAQLPFDEESDVVPRVTLSPPGEALARGGNA